MACFPNKLNHIVSMLACLVGLVLSAPWALAAENEEPEEDTIEVRAKRIDEDSLRPSAQFNLLRPEDLGPGLRSLGELARLAPAVRLQDMGGLGQPLTLGLRGASGKQTAVLLDGIALPDMLGTGVDLSLVSIDFLDRLEIVRGAASAGVGSGALGGRVELRSRELNKPGSFARLSAGSFGTWSAAAGAAWPAGDAGVMLLGSGMVTQGDFIYRDDGGTPSNPYDDRDRLRENNDSRHLGLLLKLEKPLGGGLRLGLMQSVQLHERGVAGLLGFTSGEARESGQGGMSHMNLRLPLGPGSLRLEGDLQVERRRFRDPLGELTGVPIDQAQEQQVGGLRAAYLWAPASAWLLQARLEGRAEGLADPRFGDPARFGLAGASSAEWRPLGDEELVTHLALRLEAVDGLALQWAPALGLRWRPGALLDLRANLARAYRVPSFAELYLEAGYAQGNPDLEAESAWCADASLAWTGARDSRLRLTGFYSRYKQLIVFEPGANFRYRPQNVGAAELAGLELEAGIRLLRSLELAAWYAYLFSADRSGLVNREGYALPGRPAHQSGLWLLWGSGRWFGRASLQWTGSNFINAANTKEIGARWQLDASLGLKVGEMRLAMQGQNLLDDRMQDVRGLPLPGLAVFVTLAWNRDERGTR